MNNLSNKPIIFSGIQPSGQLNIAHYIGAIKNWVSLQQQYDCLFCLVDLHAITVKQDPAALREHCYQMIALYIACGIDPEKNLIFLQSQAPAHSELAWILNCFAYMGELNRMTQFKDKSKQHAQNINVGLFDYPVLMAADILLYQTKLVPVGEDQTQHLELTRDLAVRFNQIYGEVFTIPERYTGKLGGRVMSLLEPTKKMSKSDANENAYITLLDTPEAIRHKLKRATTDSGKEIHYDIENKPGIANLLTILSSLTGQSMEQLTQHYATANGYSGFKSDVAEAIIQFLTPIQTHYAQLRADKSLLEKILRQGAEQAQQRGQKTLQKVREAIGFIA